MDENNVKLRNCFVEETSKGKILVTWCRSTVPFAVFAVKVILNHSVISNKLPQGFIYRQLHLTLAIPYLTIP